MRIVTHREMCDQSAEILREVAAGATVQVTSNGEVVALIVPPADAFAGLVSRGQVRVAQRPPSSLASIPRRPAEPTSAEIVADIRGRW